MTKVEAVRGRRAALCPALSPRHGKLGKELGGKMLLFPDRGVVQKEE